MKRFTRTVCVFLAALLICQLLPMVPVEKWVDVVRADIAGGDTASEVVASGVCGESITWSLDNIGVLTIMGTGDMTNYKVANVPWAACKEQIKSVVFEGDITSIGRAAFNGCSGITSIIIPDSVTSIETWAFGRNPNLTDIIIPEGITQIADCCFYECTGLKNITIPSSVTSIGDCAFLKCSEITNIKLPDNITSIGREAFSGCTGLSTIIIPESVTTIGKGAFENCNLSTVIVDENSYSQDAFPDTHIDNIIYYYEVNYISEGNGTVFGPSKSYPNETIEIIVSPIDDFLTEKVSITYGDTNIEIKPDSDGKYYYTMPDSEEPVAIKASFIDSDTEPSGTPSTAPTGNPTPVPTELVPSVAPTQSATPVPTEATSTPSPTVPNGTTRKPNMPTNTPRPTSASAPTTKPTATPTATPAVKPTSMPTEVPDEGGVAGFVERLYSVALGRPSDPGGKADWIQRISSGEITGGEAARGYFLSDEFINMNLSNHEFVNRLYHTFFDRDPDEGGYNGWMTQLYNGASRESVLVGFINSTEWANLCLRYGIASGGNGVPNITIEPNQQIIDFATRLYTTCLGRPADQGGLEDWSRQLANMQISGSDAAHGFFFSNEFMTAGYSDAEYVTRLYRTFMNREPDRGGFADWIGRLAAGASREEVFQGFAGSAEWAGICAEYGILK